MGLWEIQFRLADTSSPRTTRDFWPPGVGQRGFICNYHASSVPRAMRAAHGSYANKHARLQLGVAIVVAFNRVVCNGCGVSAAMVSHHT